MDHIYEINGLPIRTGDILCMRDGGRCGVFERICMAFGALIPGEIDHCALYVDQTDGLLKLISMVSPF